MNKLRSLLLITLIGVFGACKKSDPPLPDNLLQFEASEQGMAADINEVTIKVKLSRTTDVAVPITLNLVSTGVTYGTEFNTDPIATNNAITLTIPAGASETSFKVKKGANVFLSNTDGVTFTIKSVANPVLLGTVSKLSLKFSAIVSSGTDMQLNGIIKNEAGSAAGNSVFVDLSNNQQTAIARASWDLGFYMGADFRVILNNTTTATAKVINKNNLNDVVAADATPAEDWNVGYDAASFKLIDDIRGDLSKTVIASVSATDADNKVYIVNRGTGGGTAARDWYKIRIIRKGADGYTLQYAKIAETTFKTIDITKDGSFNFKHVSFDTGAVQAEPAKNKWDFVWTYATYETSYAGTMVPYASSDLVLINSKANVQAAEVLTSNVGYDAYDETKIASTTFVSANDVVGNKWRTVTMSGTGSGVNKDRFYVIKDADGNIYKLKFISYRAEDGGERGKPKFTYKLVKKA